MDEDDILVGEIKSLQQLKNKASPNLLEQRMIKAFGNQPDQYINIMLSRKYLSAGLLKKAKQVLSKNANQDEGSFQYNPFLTALTGNNRGITKAPNDPKFNKASHTQLDVINIMIDLEQSLKDDPSNAEHHFRLRTVYYNMNWFGNSPLLVRSYRTTRSWQGGEINFDKAKYHYEQALTLSQDRELKAITLYALAKIEENELYIKNDNYWSKKGYYDEYKQAVLNNKKFGLGKYFKELVNYQDTQYFKDVIQQCADYRFYWQ